MRRVLLGSVVAVALAGLTGCGGAGGGNSIVGTWEKACFQPTGNAFHWTKAGSFNQDNTYTLTSKSYTDNKCTQDESVFKYYGTYKIGAASKDSNGIDTTEIDMTRTKYVNGDYVSTEKLPWYSMYRFLDNGNLVFAHGKKDGKSKETRADYIGSKWTGYKKK